MPRTYIEWCELLNACSAHSYAARTPQQHNYWLKRREQLRKKLIARGWDF